MDRFDTLHGKIKYMGSKNMENFFFLNQMTILRVGSQVGANEGSIVGVLVGLDGRIVEGLVVRVILGRIDIVGDSVGTMNGSIVGASVGSKVGS